MNSSESAAKLCPLRLSASSDGGTRLAISLSPSNRWLGTSFDDVMVAATSDWSVGGMRGKQAYVKNGITSGYRERLGLTFTNTMFVSANYASMGMWRDNLRRIPPIGFFLVEIRSL